jgi:hypothetical protein
MKNMGCFGGYVTNSLFFMEQYGFSDESCSPYLEKNMFCTFRCNDTSVIYKKYFCKKNSMQVFVSVDDIKSELMTNGPLMVGLGAYDDLFTYASGIY